MGRVGWGSVCAVVAAWGAMFACAEEDEEEEERGGGMLLLCEKLRDVVAG